MFRQYMLTFLEVAERKSFSAAAEKLYVVPNTVKKRVEALEQETGLRLFWRTNRGCELTPAGASLYKEFRKIYQLYQDAVAKAADLQDCCGSILPMGIMPTFADSFLTNNWHNIRQKIHHQQIQIRQYGSALSEMEEMFRDVGSTTIFCVDIYDEELAAKYGLTVRKISSFPFCIGIPCHTAISPRSPLPPALLSGHCVVLPPEGRAKVFDSLRQELLQKAPGVRIESIDEYSIRSMNDVSMKQKLVLLGQNQTANYPFFTFVPLATGQTIDFGIYYKAQDERKLRDFLRKITAEE